MTDALLPAVIAGGAVIMGAAMALFGVVLGHLFRRMADQERSIMDLWKAREQDALVKRAMGDHIDTLETQIRILGGTPPPRPAGV